MGGLVCTNHQTKGMDINEEIRQSAEKLSLTLDTPESVKQQIKQITLAQKQLRVVKKKLSATVRSINQQAVQSSADSLGSVVFDILGKRKVAGSLRAEKRHAIQRSKQNARQPYFDLQAVINELILEGDRLKVLADEYLLDPEGVKARLQAEEERKRQEEEERRREEEERKRQQEEVVKTLLQIPKTIFLQLSQFLDAPLNNNQWLKKQAANLVEQGRMTSQYNALRFLKSWAKSLFLVTAILLGLLLLSPVNVFFSYLLFLALLLLFLLSPIALIVGLIRPSLVIPTASPTRIKALISYGLATVLFFVLLGFSSLLVPQQTANQAELPSTSSPNLESPTPPSPSPSSSLTPQQRAPENPEVEQSSRPEANSTLDRNTLPSGKQQSSGASGAREAATVTSVAVLTATDPNSQINLRETPSPSGKRLGYGLVGDRVGIIEKKTGDDGSTWYLVKFPRSGAQGWIREDFVTLNGTSQPPEVSPSPTELSTPSESLTPEIGSPIRSPISGSCQCPYDTDSRGRQCGARSAYSRPGGGSPRCYVGE